MSSVCGFAGTVAWYLLAYRSTSIGWSGLSVPGILGVIHPIVAGTLASYIAFLLFTKKTARKTEANSV
jgi:hypothetical protein